MTELVYIWRDNPRRGQKRVDRIPLEELEDFKTHQGVIDDLLTTLDNQASNHSALVDRVSQLSQIIDNFHPSQPELPSPPPPPAPPPPIAFDPVLAWPPSMVPITWSVDWSKAPAQLTRADMLAAMRRVFAEYTMAGLSFRELSSGIGTLHIEWDDVDGRGGTLAFVLQPATGLNMAACGGQCGDYTFDLADGAVYSIIDFENIFKHETGHAIGMDHLTTGIMRPTYQNGTPVIALGQPVIDYVFKGYPPRFV